MFKKAALLVILVISITSLSIAQESWPPATVYLPSNSDTGISTTINVPTPGTHRIGAYLFVVATGAYEVSGMVTNSNPNCSLVIYGGSATNSDYTSEVFGGVVFTEPATLRIRDYEGTATSASYYQIGPGALENQYD